MSETERTSTGTRLRWAGFALAWIVVALLSGLGSWAQARWEGEEVGLWAILSWRFLQWSLWALWTPLVLQLGTRFPLERGRWRRILPVHLGAALAMAALHEAAYMGVVALVEEEAMAASGGSFVALWLRGLSFRLYVDLIAYAAVLGAGTALDYHRRYREREIAASRLQARLARAQLQALRAQLQPHFLFNALNAATGLVRSGERDAAVRMLAGIGDLLRMTLQSGDRQEVSLGEEIDFLRRYLDVQRARFSDRLSARIDVDDDLLDARVPHLLLQPLVENAVRHGVDRLEAPGRILVRARRRDGRLLLDVEDNGPGFAADAGDGIGLRNTRERLRQLYGEGDFALRLESSPEGGGKVRLEIPLRTGRG